jgi:hypothetical protein
VENQEPVILRYIPNLPKWNDYDGVYKLVDSLLGPPEETNPMTAMDWALNFPKDMTDEMADAIIGAAERGNVDYLVERLIRACSEWNNEGYLFYGQRRELLQRRAFSIIAKRLSGEKDPFFEEGEEEGEEEEEHPKGKKKGKRRGGRPKKLPIEKVWDQTVIAAAEESKIIRQILYQYYPKESKMTERAREIAAKRAGIKFKQINAYFHNEAKLLRGYLRPPPADTDVVEADA